MKINKNLLTKVTFIEENYFWDIEHTKVRCFEHCTKTLMPSVFGASTGESVVKAAYQLRHGIKALDSIKSITEQVDGSFIVENEYGTLRYKIEQEAPKPRTYTEDEIENWIAENHADFPIDI